MISIWLRKRDVDSTFKFDEILTVSSCGFFDDVSMSNCCKICARSLNWLRIPFCMFHNIFCPSNPFETKLWIRASYLLDEISKMNQHGDKITTFMLSQKFLLVKFPRGSSPEDSSGRMNLNLLEVEIITNNLVNH